MEKKKENLFDEKSYTIYARIHDYKDQDDKALSFGASCHISKLSADTFWCFFRIIKDDCLKDNHLETGKNESEMLSEVLFQNFNKESLDEQESLENAIRNYIEKLRKYEFFEPDPNSLEKISFSDLMKTIEAKLKALREEKISFWERLFEVYKKNKKHYDTQVIKRFDRMERTNREIRNKITLEDIKSLTRKGDHPEE